MTQKHTISGKEIRSGITKYERYENGQPVYGGVNDPRMGTVGMCFLILFIILIFIYFNFYLFVDKNTGRCKTCDCTYVGSSQTKMNDCPGHFGHIELAKPVYHVGYIDQVVKILRCVCYNCSRLMIDRNNHKVKRILLIKDPETRMRHLHELCKSKKRCELG